MSEAKSTEPSMEEILASIRRIIAEDGEPPRAGEAPSAAAEPPQDEVLELTEVVDEQGQPLAAAPEPAAPEPPRSPPPSEPPRPAAAPTAAEGDDRLVSAATAAASASALAAQLAGLRRKPDSGLALAAGYLTIEELVRDMLRPMLREWLDANLPGLVERIVREEVSRIVAEAQAR